MTIASGTGSTVIQAASPVADVTPPVAILFDPPNGATGVVLGHQLAVTFDEPVVMGALGSITLRKTNDDSIFHLWSLSSDIGSAPGQVEVVDGNRMVLHTPINLATATQYYITYGAGIVQDLAGNPCAILSSTTAWSFQTGAATKTSRQR